ncbi:MAG: PASTA domain-containing protein [Paramuribaculum sp.]|nr:PASTA domain-containing protein [Paramuribaculum sp.]
MDNNPTKNKSRHPFGRAVLVNIGIMLFAAALLIWFALVWLDFWTDHGHYETVPQVKGLSYDVAVGQLESMGYTAEVSDSIYDSRTRPGTVVEQNPKVGTKVKEGRVVYLTITAFEPKMVTVPMLVDVSERQARSALEGLGIKNIRTVRVPSEFRDLVLSVKKDNVPIAPGARIAVTSAVVLEVGEGSVAGGDDIAAEEQEVQDAADALSSYFD